MRLPTVAPGREPLTLSEARRVGATANRLTNLLDLIGKAKGGSIAVQTPTGTVSLSLVASDVIAALSLLAERDSTFLVSFNVEIG